MTESIVLTVCREHGISPSDFFSRRTDSKIVACRVAAIHKLRASGFNQMAISRLIKREYSVVRYWLHPEYRERKKERDLASYHLRKGKRGGDTATMPFIGPEAVAGAV